MSTIYVLSLIYHLYKSVFLEIHNTHTHTHNDYSDMTDKVVGRAKTMKRNGQRWREPATQNERSEILQKDRQNGRELFCIVCFTRYDGLRVTITP